MIDYRDGIVKIFFKGIANIVRFTLPYSGVMLVYAGIDEAGYGPLFGPLVIGRAVFGIESRSASQATAESSAQATTIAPDLWKLLAKAVCRELNDKRGRIAINDSKKLKTPAAGIRHMELGVLAFAMLKAGIAAPPTICDWMDAIGVSDHHQLNHLPWYCADDARPWNALPLATTAGELAIARNMLSRTTLDCGIRMLDLGAAVVFEDRFNRMVAATRSKASASFTFVASHLNHIWQQYGQHSPIVAIDRQSGRTRYRELLAQCFPSASITILDETNTLSAYRLRETAGSAPRSMTVQFEVNGDGLHLPISLASMISKYTRELMMTRFKAWFSEKLPHIQPTAGYGSDAKRFWIEVEPHLESLGILRDQLRRMA